MKLISPLSWLNSHLFRPLFIGYNPGFHAFNLIRDFQRFWKNMPDMSIFTAFKRYYQAMPVARVRAFGLGKNPTEELKKAEQMLQELEKEKIFSITHNDFILGETNEDKQINVILEQSGINTIEKQRTNWNKLMIPFVKILDTLSAIGNYIETLPKVAGVLEMTKGTRDVSTLTKEQGSYIRTKIGSPDFLRKGYATPITNEIFLFSNAIKEGIRSDIDVASNPKTRSGFWWKTAKIAFIPKILMFMMAIGLFGKKAKEIMDKQSEYDKTNYTIISLGQDKNGKAISLRLPQDETSRFLSGILWKVMSSFNPDKQITLGQDLSEIFSFMGGQIPSLTPSISTPKAILTYISGQNPYDAFRGRNVLSDELFKANNWKTDKAFIGYIFNQVGGNIIYNFMANGSIPAKQSTSEEIVKLPIVSNVIGRFIRVSDYGITEQLNKVKANVQSEQAQESLENKDLVNKYVKQALNITDKVKLRQLELDMVKEKFNEQPTTEENITKAKGLITKFRSDLTKGVSSPEVDALISAQTNKEKIELLKNIKTRMTDDEFKVLKNTVLKERIVSAEAFYKFEHEK